MIVKKNKKCNSAFGNNCIILAWLGAWLSNCNIAGRSIHIWMDQPTLRLCKVCIVYHRTTEEREDYFIRAWALSFAIFTLILSDSAFLLIRSSCSFCFCTWRGLYIIYSAVYSGRKVHLSAHVVRHVPQVADHCPNLKLSFMFFSSHTAANILCWSRL